MASAVPGRVMSKCKARSHSLVVSAGMSLDSRSVISPSESGSISFILSDLLRRTPSRQRSLALSPVKEDLNDTVEGVPEEAAPHLRCPRHSLCSWSPTVCLPASASRLRDLSIAVTPSKRSLTFAFVILFARSTAGHYQQLCTILLHVQKRQNSSPLGLGAAGRKRYLFAGRSRY